MSTALSLSISRSKLLRPIMDEVSLTTASRVGGGAEVEEDTPAIRVDRDLLVVVVPRAAWRMVEAA